MRRALFLHIQKTAGTSLQVMARVAFGDDQVTSHHEYIQMSLAELAKFDFVSGHFGFSFAKAVEKAGSARIKMDPSLLIPPSLQYRLRSHDLDRSIRQDKK